MTEELLSGAISGLVGGLGRRQNSRDRKEPNHTLKEMALWLRDTVTRLPTSLWGCAQLCCGKDEVLQSPPRLQGPPRMDRSPLEWCELYEEGERKHTFNKIPVDEEK